MIEFGAFHLQSGHDIPQRVLAFLLGIEHCHKVLPGGEIFGVSIAVELIRQLREFIIGQELEQLIENSVGRFHGLSLQSLKIVASLLP